jgi:CheY-like chemotaxis protein
VSKRKLLLADDSITIQKVVNLTFADEGIDVITVGDGDSAMQKISEISPDVVLADVHMPGLSGYQICEIVRDNPATKDLPVVLLVGSFEPFDESEAARVGANAFLTKPFQSIRQLVTQVSDLMESSSAKAEDGDVSFEDTDEDLPTTASIEETDAATASAAEAPRVPDTSDIESLIRQSFGAPVEEAGDVPPSHFVDAGMDDEMIETSHADDVAVETHEEFAEETDFDERTPSEDEYQTEPNVSSPFDTIAVADETTSIVEEPAESEAYFDQFASTERMHTLEEQVAEAAASSKLDEGDLLELPPLENGKTVEFTTTENVSDDPAKKQVMSLSPELMDIIVQKVVEKLSEK